MVLQLGVSHGEQTGLRFEIPQKPHEIVALSELMRIGAAAAELQGFKKERRQKQHFGPRILQKLTRARSS